MLEKPPSESLTQRRKRASRQLRGLRAAGHGNLTLRPDHQAPCVWKRRPWIFLPFLRLGNMGHTHIRVAAESENLLTRALRTPW